MRRFKKMMMGGMVRWDYVQAVRYLALTALFACYAILCPLAVQAQAKAPYNVIVVLVDDMGWVDTTVQMRKDIPDSKTDFYETPNLEKLARDGMRFSDAYSASPICSPARASLLTGISPQRLQITDIIGSQPGSKRYSDYYVGKKLISQPPLKGLPPAVKTIAELLKAGRPNVMAAHFGKWHIGSGGPEMHGFDAGDGSSGNGSAHGGAGFWDDPDPKSVFGVTSKAIDFMKQAAAASQPFYVQLSHYAVHLPERSLKSTLHKYEGLKPGAKHHNARYAAMIEDFDTSVGQLLQALDDLGLKDNTYIILTSDNGGSMDVKEATTSNAPLSKGKTWVYEGGIRVPMFVRGPGIKAGGYSQVPVIAWDIVPTVCEMMGCKGDLPKDVEGGSLLPLLQGKAKKVKRPRGETLVWSFPHYLTIKGTTPQVAIRKGHYKLIKMLEPGESMLFDLAKDIGETKDLSAMYPNKTRALEEMLDRYLQEVNATVPVRNEAYLP